MEDLYLSHPRAITLIREPIHDTAAFGCFGREIIDSPYFQRLHYILQNSTTYVAYPSNKNTRFTHSLGVARLCGQILCKALSQSNTKTLKGFLGDTSHFIDDRFVVPIQRVGGTTNYKEKLISGWKATVHGHSGFSHRHFLSTEEHDPPVCWDDDYDGFPAGFLVDTLWQCIQLCGLAHDIGHLPMSHSFEHALEKPDGLFDEYEKILDRASNRRTTADHDKNATFDQNVLCDSLIKEHGDRLFEAFGIDKKAVRNYLAQDLPEHELRSLVILNFIFKNNRMGHPQDGGQGAFDYRNLVFQLTFLVLYASSTDAMPPVSGDEAQKAPKFLRTLKTIIAGEIDADRMDYTIRDGHACGSLIGGFDLQRVVNNAILIEQENRFFVAYYYRALSGIENFFEQRAQSYHRLIYHRTSSRSETCLQELLGRLLHASLIDGNSEIAKALEQFGFISRSTGRINRILPINEHTLESTDDASLRALLFQIRKHLSQDTEIDLDQRLLWPIKVLCEVVLLREFRSLASLFKERDLFDAVSEKTGADCDQIRKKFYDAWSDSKRPVLSMHLKQSFHDEFGGNVVLMLCHQKPKPFSVSKMKGDDRIFIVEADGAYSPIEQRSARLARMAEELKSDSRINAYVIRNPDSESESGYLKQCRNEISSIEDFFAQKLVDLLPEYAV